MGMDHGVAEKMWIRDEISSKFFCLASNCFGRHLVALSEIMYPKKTHKSTVATSSLIMASMAAPLARFCTKELHNLTFTETEFPEIRFWHPSRRVKRLPWQDPTNSHDDESAIIGHRF